MNQPTKPLFQKESVPPTPSGVVGIREYFEFSDDMYCEVDSVDRWIVCWNRNRYLGPKKSRSDAYPIIEDGITGRNVGRSIT